MTVTVNPQFSIAAVGSTNVNITCASDAASPSWSTSGLSPDFQDANFSSNSASTTTLTFTVNPNESSDRLNQYHSFDVGDGHSSARVEVYVVASGITSDDIIIMRGTDGNTYLLTQVGNNPPQISAALQYTPTVIGTQAATTANQFAYVDAPQTGAGAGTVTCYILSMSSLQTG